jgi:integrase
VRKQRLLGRQVYLEPAADQQDERRPGLVEEIRPMVGRQVEQASNSDTRLFTGPRGGRISTAVLRDATHWDEVVTALGYEHLRQHDLRHTGLTWME